MDTVQTGYSDELSEREQHNARTRKPLLVVGMVGIVMLFAGLTSAYIIRQADGNWLTFDLPSTFYWSTLFIVLSSATLIYANKSAKSNNFKAVEVGIALTFVL